MFGKSEIKKNEGREMKVYGNTQTDENSLNCKQGVLPGIQESKYQPIRGKWMKEGKV